MYACYELINCIVTGFNIEYLYIQIHVYSKAQSSPSFKYVTDLYNEILVPRHQTNLIKPSLLFQCYKIKIININ